MTCLNVSLDTGKDTDEDIEVFVPGRLCILGEHSDWAADYRGVNPAISYG